MTATMKTRTIAGHKITLEVGLNYLASRPMMTRKGQRFNVSITEDRGPVAHVIRNLSYDEANDFLTAFNNQESSFMGRTW